MERILLKRIMLIDKNKTVNYSGGVEKVICNFANEFTKRGYEVYIVCIDAEKGRPAFYLENNVHFINLCYSYEKYDFVNFRYQLIKIQREIMRGLIGREMTFLGVKFSDPKEMYFYAEFRKRLTKCLLDICPDIILPTDVEATVVVNDVLKRIKRKIPVISMCHGDPSFLKYTARGIDSLRESQRVQVLLPEFAEFLKKLGVNNTVVIPNAVEMFSRERDKDNSREKTIINVARIDGGGKRQEIIVEAFATLVNKFPDWKVDFWGDIANQGYKKRLDKIIKKYGLKKYISFRGTTNDMFSVYSNADIFAFPSSHEGFGMSMVEAMSAGIPVVAYKNCKGPAAIITNEVDGFLCKDGVEDFSSKMCILMENAELRKKMGIQASLKALEYEPTKVWDRWETIIDDYL